MTNQLLCSLGLLLLCLEAIKCDVNDVPNVAEYVKYHNTRSKRSSFLDDPEKLSLLKTILDDEGPKNTLNGFSLRGTDYDNNCFPQVDFKRIKSKNKYPRFEDCQSYYYFYEKEAGQFHSEIIYCLDTEIFDPKSGKCLYFGHRIIPEKCQNTCKPRDLSQDIKLEPLKMPIGVMDFMKVIKSESDFVSFYFKNFYSELLQAYIKHTNKYASETFGTDGVDSYIPAYHSVSKRLDSVVRDVTFRLFYVDAIARSAPVTQYFDEDDEIVKQIQKLIQSETPRIIKTLYKQDSDIKAKSNSEPVKRKISDGKGPYNFEKPEGELLEIRSKAGNEIKRQTFSEEPNSTLRKMRTTSKPNSVLHSSNEEKYSHLEFIEL